jgi:hypothetical protein
MQAGGQGTLAPLVDNDDGGEDPTPHVPDSGKDKSSKRRKVFDENGDLLGTYSEDDIDDSACDDTKPHSVIGRLLRSK